MDIKKLNFLEYAEKVGYGWYIIILIPFVVFSTINAVVFHDISVLVVSIVFYTVVGILIFFHAKSGYNEYLKFINIAESEDCLLYISKIKASGMIQGYDFGKDCSIVIKKDSIYWLNNSFGRSRGSSNSLFCLYFSTIASWKITSRGDIQLKSIYPSSINSFPTVSIFSNIDEIIKYLPPNLKIDK